MKRILKVSGRGIVNILLFLIFFIPFYWMALTSVKTLGQTLQSPPIFWVKNPQFQNFVTAFKSIHFMHYLKNSVITTAGILVAQLHDGCSGGVCLCQIRLQGKRDFLRNGAGNNDDSGTACIFTGISCAQQNGTDKHLLVTDFTSGNQCFRNFHAETELYCRFQRSL